MTGFINIDKPQGDTSAKIVAAVKRKFSVPCGHMGTLDPLATGVLPVGIGKTSRLFPYLINKTKVYRATFLFGISTDTLDITGKTEKTTEYIPSETEIKNCLYKFIGEIDQIPPKYSSKCVNGKRGYALARKGVEFSLPPKKVNISDIKLCERAGEREFVFEIICKGGTYIRSLARDIGESVGSLAVMSSLIRKASGKFTLENAVSLQEFIDCEDPQKFVIPADFAVDFEKIVLTSERAQKILDGVYSDYGYKDGIYRVYNEDKFWGIGESSGGILRIKAYVR